MELNSAGICRRDFEQRFMRQAGELLAEGGIMSLDFVTESRRNAIFHTKRNGNVTPIILATEKS